MEVPERSQCLRIHAGGAQAECGRVVSLGDTSRALWASWLPAGLWSRRGYVRIVLRAPWPSTPARRHLPPRVIQRWRCPHAPDPSPGS